MGYADLGRRFWPVLLSAAAAMDLLKTRMQQEASADRLAFPSRGGPRKRTQRLVNTTRLILHHDGWRGLWRGTGPTVARNVPGVALYFYSVSEIRALLARSAIPYLSLPSSLSTGSSVHANASTLARLTVPGNLVSGAVARVAVGFLLSPVTVVKARFESSHFSRNAYPSLAKALGQIYRNEGVKGLFRGFSATAMRDAPYAGIYLAAYEKSKDGLGKWERAGGRGSGSSVVVGVSGEYRRCEGMLCACVPDRSPLPHRQASLLARWPRWSRIRLTSSRHACRRRPPMPVRLPV
ncbi:hypothetical protein L7F22_047099 [Adiantum nelumboides]|nr:hypothetical protein [Adiantum nelumboides]